MILTCPQCNARFMLAAEILGAEGHKVKCSDCGEIWHQEPDPEELGEVEAPEDDFPDLPVAEVPQESEVVPDQDEDEQDEKGFITRKALMGSIAASFILFIVILAVFISMHKTVLSAWPASASFYQIVGIEMKVPGEGLVFDKIKVKAAHKDKGELVTVTGDIINLTSETRDVPLIEASIKGKGGKVAEQWLIVPSEPQLESEATLTFQSEHVTHIKEASDVHLRFVLGGKAPAKTGAAAGDSNQAQHQGDQTHQSGDGAHAKSPAHASFQPH